MVVVRPPNRTRCRCISLIIDKFLIGPSDPGQNGDAYAADLILFSWIYLNICPWNFLAITIQVKEFQCLYIFRYGSFCISTIPNLAPYVHNTIAIGIIYFKLNFPYFIFFYIPIPIEIIHQSKNYFF